VFNAAAWLVVQFFNLTHNFGASVALVALSIMLLITPLTLKSTKGMLEMQRLQPEMKKLQNQYRGDRTRLNEEMMKLYQEHKVNPLASCLPLLAQMPVFIIMFRVLRGLTRLGKDGTFDPKYISHTTDLYKALDGTSKMKAFGIDLAITPGKAMSQSLTHGIWYALLIVLLGGLFFLQQRMVANRAASPTMSAGQAKMMQYLPVAFALFQVLLPTSLVIYYMTQAIVRIVQQGYITRRFYGEGGLGHQAQQASAKAREMGDDKADSKDDAPAKGSKFGKRKEEVEQAPPTIQSKRVTPSKNRPTPSGRPTRPVPPGKRDKNK
jgi:YidC/Oxa1 family membrane protein insertase